MKGPPLVGDLRIEEVHDEELRRYLRTALLWDEHSVLPSQDRPRLFDVRIIAMSPLAFSLSGFERIDGTEYAQSWLVQSCPSTVAPPRVSGYDLCRPARADWFSGCRSHPLAQGVWSSLQGMGYCIHRLLHNYHFHSSEQASLLGLPWIMRSSTSAWREVRPSASGAMRTPSPSGTSVTSDGR